jgi:hypothetical protein
LSTKRNFRYIADFGGIIAYFISSFLGRKIVLI